MSSIKKTAERLAAKRGQDEGFTLIELLVVIVILGVLAAVVVFSVGGITGRGESAACLSSVKTLEVGVEAWKASQPSNTAYPLAINLETALTPEFLRSMPPAATYTYTEATGAVAELCP
ncbi:MAG: type II secretion system protein [Acidimicrobiales bacterium]